MEITFILVEPSTPENVSAAARAIKTMGFKKLRLVNPCDHLSAPARWLAHASNDILENATVYRSFDDAIVDCDFRVGTTAKQRNVKEDYLSLSNLPGLLTDKGETIDKIAIIFGREDTGLRNEELAKCDLLSTVPLQTTYPSLNLAQSAMLYAYELSVLKASGEENTRKETGQESFRNLKDKVQNILVDLNFKEESAILPRIIERLNQLQESDIHLLHSICNKYIEKNS
ncbi:tRNA/rRNA methyltransferase [Sunxiuqinia sp. A32]|uniref:tRNA/rRNA methyltransferase n=1 Tax=Sunxiuqinia sp. A32 TaxID=3461496 RepID=UPI00404684F7